MTDDTEPSGDPGGQGGFSHFPYKKTGSARSGRRPKAAHQVNVIAGTILGSERARGQGSTGTGRHGSDVLGSEVISTGEN